MVAAQTWTTPTIGLAANALLAWGAWSLAGARRGLGPRQTRGPARWLAASVVFWSASTIGLELLSAFNAIAALPILGCSAFVALLALAVARAGPRAEGPGPNFESADAGQPPLGAAAALALAVVLAAAAHLVLISWFLGVKVVSDGPIYHLYFAARWWKAGRLALVAAPFGESAATYFPANGDLWFTWLMVCWGGERLAKVGQAPFLLLAGAAAYGCARELGTGRDASLIATCWFVSSTPLLLFSAEANVDTIFVAGQMLAAYFLLRGLRGERRVANLALGALAAGLAIGTKAVGVVFVPPILGLALAAVFVSRWYTRRGKIARALVLLLVPFVTGGYWFARDLWLTGNPLYPLNLEIFGRALWPGWYGPEAMKTSPFYIPVGAWRELVDIVMAVFDPRLAPVWLAAIVGGWAARDRRAADPASAVETDAGAAGSARWAAVFAVLAAMQVALYWLVVPYRTQQRFMLQALGLAVVPLARVFDWGPWARRGGAFLVALHVLTPQPWPFLSADGSAPWDLSPRVPNAVPALLPLFSFSTRGPSPRGAGGMSASIHWIALGTIASAFFLVRARGRAAERSRSTSMGRSRNDRGPSHAAGGPPAPPGKMGRPSFRGRIEIAIKRRGRAKAVAFAAGIAFAACCAIDVAPRALSSPSRFYDPGFDFFPGWIQFEARCGPAGARVAYAGNDLPYYLLGERLRNDVRYVNINRHRDWLMHDYHREARARGGGLWPNSRPGWDRAERDVRAWIENLDAEGIEFLVVTRANPNEGAHNIADGEGFPIERAWAEAHPERFQRLYGARENDPWFRLYRVARPR